MRTSILILSLLVLSPVSSFAIFYGISDSAGLTQYSNTGTQTSLASINGRSLALDQTNDNLYLGTLTGITRTDLSGNNAATLITEGSPIGGIALDVANETIYYSVDTTGGNGLVKSINFDGSGATTLFTSSLSSLVMRQLDIDLVGQKLYYAEGPTSGSGGRMQKGNLNGTGLETISSGSNPFGVAVNGYEPKFYGSLGQSGTVYKSDLDGTNSSTLKSSLIQVRSISGDYANDLIYYVYRGGTRLASVGTDGTGNQDVFNLQSNTHQVTGNFTPVPEPSTYALVLSVFSFTFFLWRRKRQRASAS